MKKRILSIIMAICLVLSCVPITVFAANADATELQGLLNGGGTVTLNRDYTIDTTLNVQKTVTLDLNGHVIKMTGSGSVILVAWCNLTLQDSNKTATHTDTSLPAGGVGTLLATSGHFVPKSDSLRCFPSRGIPFRTVILFSRCRPSMNYPKSTRKKCNSRNIARIAF